MDVDSESEPTSSALEETSTIVRSVYKETWQIFYAWEQDHCRRSLDSLARNISRTADVESSSLTGRDFSTAATSTPISNGDESFSMYTYGEDNPEVFTLSVETVEVIPPFKTCPPYEICTPASRNIYVGDDFSDMPFIQLADDPTFDYEPHTADYARFEWQLPNRDPDLDIILVKTVYTLNVQHQIPFETIDGTGVLPLEILYARGSVLDIALHRDFPTWLNIPTRPPLQHVPTHIAARPKDNLTNILRYFCNNRNCLISYCTVHIKTDKETMAEIPLPEPTVPTVLSGALFHSVEAPCSKECFLLGNPPSIASGTFWSEEDTEICDAVLLLSPDLSPCDLAVICRKPCHEVFKHRRRALPDSEILLPSDKVNKRRTVRSTVHPYRDLDAAFFTPKLPCSHLGPCDARSNCSCFFNHAHCESGCRCDRKCKYIRTVIVNGPDVHVPSRNFVGHAGQIGAHVSVLTESAIRKFVSNARRNPAADICRNASIQWGELKRTEVRQSQWGLGLYLLEDAQKGDLIIEYTGELIFNKTVDCRDLVARHRDRVYLFELNPTLSIDSSKAGNESRFINHDPTNANSDAGIRLVNGEHRIGVFAVKNLTSGTEVLLNYGDSFFKNESDEGHKKRKEVSIENMLELDQHSSDETYNE